MKKALNVLLIAVLMLSHSSYTEHSDNQDVGVPRLTVWVHGTTIRAIVPFKNLIPNFHFPSKFMPFAELRKDSEAYRRAIALYKGDAESFPLDSFYLFRWNGLLNYKERAAAAQDLYQALLKQIELIKKRTGKYPLITIIAHSHGSNIALQLARINRDKIKINKLVLLACPVQDGTAGLVRHHTFERIYAFYSESDFIVPLALQNFTKFSERKFTISNSKLVHVKTCWKRYGLLHNDFKGIPFVAKLSIALRAIDQKCFKPECNSVNKNYNLVL